MVNKTIYNKLVRVRLCRRTMYKVHWLSWSLQHTNSGCAKDTLLLDLWNDNTEANGCLRSSNVHYSRTRTNPSYAIVNITVILRYFSNISLVFCFEFFHVTFLFISLLSGAQSVQLRGISQPDNIYVLGWTFADPKRSHSVPGDGRRSGSIRMASFQVDYTVLLDIRVWGRHSQIGLWGKGNINQSSFKIFSLWGSTHFYLKTTPINCVSPHLMVIIEQNLWYIEN